MSEAEAEIKGGHLPAVKVGGMRIARTTHSTGEGKEKPEMTEEEIEEYGSSSPPKTDKQVLVSGALTKVEKAFPPEAVQSYHEKVVPKKEKLPVHHINHINQPQ